MATAGGDSKHPPRWRRGEISEPLTNKLTPLEMLYGQPIARWVFEGRTTEPLLHYLRLRLRTERWHFITVRLSGTTSGKVSCTSQIPMVQSHDNTEELCLPRDHALCIIVPPPVRAEEVYRGPRVGNQSLDEVMVAVRRQPDLVKRCLYAIELALKHGVVCAISRRLVDDPTDPLHIPALKLALDSAVLGDGGDGRMKMASPSSLHKYLKEAAAAEAT